MKFQNVKSLNTTRFVMYCVTTMHVAGTTVTAPLTLMILGKTAQLHSSAGATLIMTDVIHSATTQDVFMMVLIVRT